MPKKHRSVDNKAILDKVEKRAYELENTFGNCSQSTLVAIIESFGPEDETLLKASSLLSGGVASGNVCGVICGALLALGTRYGRDPKLLKGSVEKARKAAGAQDVSQKLIKWFEREFGNLNCSELRKAVQGTTLDRGIPWQKEVLDKLDSHKHCAVMAGKTARRAAAMLDNPDLSILDKA